MKRVERKPIIMLYIVYGVYLLYYLADMNTSANTLVKQTSGRASVHLYLTVLIIILSIYFIFSRYIYINDKFRRGFFLLIIWCACVDIVNSNSFWSIATHVGLLVLFYLSSYFSSVYIDTQDKYNRIMHVELALWVITMYYGIKAYYNYSAYLGKDSNVLNMAYNVLAFLPLLLQLRNTRIRNITVIVSIVYVIVSLKRGAILAMIGMIIVYYYTMSKSNTFGKIGKKKIIAEILTIVVIIALATLINDQMNGELFNRFTIDELRFGSNRNEIYNDAITLLKNRGLLKLFLGTGSGSTMKLIGSGAHNEGLELMISYGIVGLFLYIFAMIGGISQFKILKTYNEKQSSVYLISLSYVFIVGLVGSALFSHMTYHIMIAMGVANSTYIVDLESEDYV